MLRPVSLSPERTPRSRDELDKTTDFCKPLRFYGSGVVLMPHGKCWLVANAGDGNTYWASVRKYSDAHETSFKAQVKILSGFACRKVRRETSEPDDGIEINL